jgi:hypothetical protein
MLTALVAALALAAPAARPADVLIVADERPAMETLARQVETRVRLTSEIITQEELAGHATPLGRYRAVVVYIHKDILEPSETAFLDYARAGGTLVLLHHSISSGKRKNRFWFPALGVTLPTGELADGGYKYFDKTTFDVVNLAPSHAVTKGVGSVAFSGTEVYINHVLAGPRTPLLGVKWRDPATGKVHEQPIAGWVKPLDSGRVFYFMPGHEAADFDVPGYAQVIANALKGAPRAAARRPPSGRGS